MVNLKQHLTEGFGFRTLVQLLMPLAGFLSPVVAMFAALDSASEDESEITKAEDVKKVQKAALQPPGTVEELWTKPYRD